MAGQSAWAEQWVAPESKNELLTSFERCMQCHPLPSTNFSAPWAGVCVCTVLCERAHTERDGFPRSTYQAVNMMK